MSLTEAHGEVYSVRDQNMNGFPKQNFCGVANRKVQLTLSNAFPASHETIVEDAANKVPNMYTVDSPLLLSLENTTAFMLVREDAVSH